MKNVVLTSLCVMFSLFSFANEKVNNNNPKIEIVNPIKKYNIPEDVYYEFKNSIVYNEEGKLIGAIYDGVEKYLDDKQSDEFWAEYGFSLRRNLIFGGTDPIAAQIFQGYKPKGHNGCRQNRRWVCVLRGTLAN
ncbi:hypothetical protein [Aureivirga marina]|uniref:hypothetical protein n=1 Tax=Aureivirga marina TaxID=1182451 RepID=UPI0018CBB48B|nr:hypothetical protein [Aureivirga marina]